ncbi:MAG: hypothetical protein HGA47_14850, partial [Zoogloea sp.]|nr:hypothetical protein [Zoogloea sp.]
KTRPALHVPVGAEPAHPASTLDASPLASSLPGELLVRELMPEEVTTPIELGDPAIPWRDAGELTRRAFALAPLDLELPPLGLWRQPDQGVRIAVRITERGEVEGVQLLTPPSPLDDALLDAMRKMHFTPGEIRGRPVPSILLLEFSLPR